MISWLHRNKSGPNSRNSNSHTGPLDTVLSTKLVKLTQWLISRLPPSTGNNLVLQSMVFSNLPALLDMYGPRPPLPLRLMERLLLKMPPVLAKHGNKETSAISGPLLPLTFQIPLPTTETKSLTKSSTDSMEIKQLLPLPTTKTALTSTGTVPTESTMLPLKLGVMP